MVFFVCYLGKETLFGLGIFCPTCKFFNGSLKFKSPCFKPHLTKVIYTFKCFFEQRQVP